MDQKTVREFCVRHVAQFIHDTVALSQGVNGQRDMLDWETAETIVDNNMSLVEEITLSLPDDCDFDLFVQRFGKVVWDAFQCLRQNLPRPPYGEIIHE